MAKISRRGFLNTVAMSGAAMIRPLPGAGAPCNSATIKGLSTAERKALAAPLIAYFQEAAPKLFRSPQGPLKLPSLSPSLPGKQYSAQLWDWDTLWTSVGLFRLANLTQDHALHAQVVEHAQGSLLNFLEHQSPVGRIPFLIGADDPEDSSPLPSSVPNPINQAKPVMAQLALVVADEIGSVAWLEPYFGKVLRFHDSWLLGNQSPTGLLVWGNDVAIGNDNDPTTFGRPFFSSANLLLNCLFYQDLRAAYTLAQKLGRTQTEQSNLAIRIDQIGNAIQKQCWHAQDSFYYSVDVQCVDHRAELMPDLSRGMSMSWSSLPLRIQVFTGFLPLWCGLASPAQAAALVQRNYLADDRFRSTYGVRSLSNRESMYSMEFSGNPSNWLGPVWIIVNYFVWKALGAYGFREAADDLAEKTIRLLAAGLKADGNLNEYYHPDTGTPLSHKGFMDWDLLVLDMINPH